jgi:hypothetical protein
VGTIDAFYTPASLARELASAMPADLNGRVFDPAVGEGALLAAVSARFGDAVDLVGLDVDAAAVGTVRDRHPDWTVGRADAINPRSRRSSAAWRLAKSDLSAVVLNPPYSYRGNGGKTVSFGAFHGRVAPAMNFLVEILLNLQPQSGVYAILPDGALDSQKHKLLWREIESRYDWSRLERFGTSSFRGARVSTSLIQVRLGGSERNVVEVIPARAVSSSSTCRCVELVRGRVPVHRLGQLSSDDQRPFLHTTNLRSQKSTMYASASLSDDGPMVILNRIGRFMTPSVLDIGSVVLSDCLIGLRPKARNQVDQLQHEIAQASPDFAGVYRGTGAQYVTVDSILRQLVALGWHPHHVPPGSAVGGCCCSNRQSIGCAQA